MPVAGRGHRRRTGPRRGRCSGYPKRVPGQGDRCGHGRRQHWCRLWGKPLLGPGLQEPAGGMSDEMTRRVNEQVDLAACTRTDQARVHRPPVAPTPVDSALGELVRRYRPSGQAAVDKGRTLHRSAFAYRNPLYHPLQHAALKRGT
jgi:hypothetical protein